MSAPRWTTSALVKVGDRARLWLGTPKHGQWVEGTVTELDVMPERPGVLIRLDEPYSTARTAYATYGEVQVLR